MTSQKTGNDVTESVIYTNLNQSCHENKTSISAH